MNNNTNTEQKNQENKCLKIRFSQAEIEGLDPRVKALTGYFDRLPKIEELQELLGVSKPIAYKLLRPLKAIELPNPRRTDGKKDSYYQIDKRAFTLTGLKFELINYLSQLNSRNGYKDFKVYSTTLYKSIGTDTDHLSRLLKSLQAENYFYFRKIQRGQFLISFKPSVIRYINQPKDNKDINPALKRLTRTLNKYANYWTKQANIMRADCPDYEERIRAIAQPKAGQSLKEMDLVTDEQPKSKEQERIAETQPQNLVDNPLAKYCRTKEEKAADEQAEQERNAEIIRKKREAEQERIAETQDLDLGLDMEATIAAAASGQFVLIPRA